MGLLQGLNNQSLSLSNSLFGLGNSTMPQLGVTPSPRVTADAVPSLSSDNSSNTENAYAKGGLVKAPGADTKEITIPAYVVKRYGADFFQRLIDSVPKPGLGGYGGQPKKS